jgi:signal transduction histidine kinase
VTLAAVLAASGCLAWAVLLHRRLARATDAAHELRGALTVVGLAVQRSGDTGLTAAYEGQLARVRAAVGDHSAQRCSLERLLRCSIGAAASSSSHGDDDVALGVFGVLGRATVAAGPAATVLGNLAANAVEHGDGPLAVRIEVVNGRREQGGSRRHHPSIDRGRGLRIAARAARAAGGRLDVRRDGGSFAAVVELPVER